MLFKKFLFLLVFFSWVNLFAVEINNKNVTSVGYIHFDQIFWNTDFDDYVSGAFFNNAGLTVKSNLNDTTLSCLVRLKFLNTKFKHNVSEAYLQYSYSDALNIKFGQLSVIPSLESITNPYYRPFMEKALLDEAILRENFLGGSFNFDTGLFNFSISLVTPELLYKFDKLYDNSRSVFLRIYTNPVGKFHLGLNYRVMNRHPEEPSQKEPPYRDRPSFTAPYALLIAHMSQIPKYTVFGYEAGFSWKFLYSQVEYSVTTVSWKDYDVEYYDNYYIQLSCFLTGESRVYNRDFGKFEDPKPKFSFGAFELSFRYSHNNLTNLGPLLNGITTYDGKKHTLVLALNWLIGDNLKIQANYAREHFAYAKVAHKHLSGLGFRVQFLF